MPDRIHIIGAGVAGLTAAVTLAKAGRTVTLYESSGQAGGRCRSFIDAQLGREIDNGTHLVLGANRALFTFLKDIGAENTLESLNFPKHLMLGEVPPSSFRSDLHLLWKILSASGNDTVASCLSGPSTSLRQRVELFAVSVLNTPPEAASARMLRRVMLDIFRQGKKGLTPFVPRRSWTESLANPAIATLRRYGSDLRFHAPVRELFYAQDKVIGLRVNEERITLAEGDTAILATSSPIAQQLIPGLQTLATCPILNIHYRFPHGILPSFIGVCGGTAHWLFFREDRISVTISAAENHMAMSDEWLAEACWRDIQTALSTEASLPLWRVIREKRATFACSPATLRQRPGPGTELRNLLLAGDYTDTGLPATLEGAVLSGRRAAEMA